MPLNTDSHNIWSNYQQLDEVKDTRRNRDSLIQAYGLMDHSNEQTAQARAKELIDKFTKLEPLIDPDNDYFGVSGKTYNPKDIFSWSRVAKDMGYDKMEALQNFEAMLVNLGREDDKKQQMKISEKDYDVVVENEYATIYRPKSEAASCKLGAGTKWCTAATQGGNQFNSYKQQGVVLFYVITKRKKFNTAVAVWPPQPAGSGFRGREPGSDFKPEQKYAIAMYPDGENFQVFDDEDNTIEWSEWEDIASEHELPTNKRFFQKYGPELIDTLRQRVAKAASVLSGQTSNDVDEFGEVENDWDLLYNVLLTVKAIYKQGDQEQISKFVKYRKQEIQPDYVFTMQPMSTHAMAFFTDREYNPVGSSNQGNAHFQAEIVRHIRRLAVVTAQVDAGGEDSQSSAEEMDELVGIVRGPNDGDEARNMFYDLRRYVSRHMGDEWPELEEALIRLWITNLKSTTIQNQSGYQEAAADPTADSLMWLRIVTDWKNGRWPEFENGWKQHIEQMIDDTTQYDQVDGILATGRIYNTIVNNIRHAGKWDQMKAWLPEEETHLQRFADGEWHEDNLPLTKRAERELAFRSRS